MVLMVPMEPMDLQAPLDPMGQMALTVPMEPPAGISTITA
jgi:hypothetical protein